MAQVTASHASARTNPPPSTTTLDHHVFTDGAWRPAGLAAHPRVRVSVSLDTTSVLLGETPPSIDIDAVVDSGAQSDLLPLSAFLSAGYQQADLRPVTLNVSAANLSPIQIEGAFLARISGQSSCGDTVTCHSMVYVSSTVRDMFLSHSTMLSLGIVGPDFPTVGVANPRPRCDGASDDASSINALGNSDLGV